MIPSILDHPLITESYFFPRREEFENPYMVECQDGPLACYYHQKFPDGKTIVFFHGNGEVAADYIDLYIPVFDKMGYNCLLAEYRGYGMSGGAPAMVGMLDDVACIIKSINQPLKNLILFGRSVGSIYALHGAGTFPEVSGLILESGIADVLERIKLCVHPNQLGVSSLQLHDEVNLRMNQQEKMKRYQGATLVLHARNDSLIDCSHGERLFRWASKPKALKLFDQGDHNDIMMVNFQEYFQEINRFLNQL